MLRRFMYFYIKQVILDGTIIYFKLARNLSAHFIIILIKQLNIEVYNFAASWEMYVT
jgi:hypothetical protein